MNILKILITVTCLNLYQGRITTSASGKWSWDASNFHKDDFVDSMYTNPNHKPFRRGRDVDMKDKARAVCTAQNIQSAELLENCIFDVEVTGDTGMANQAAFSLGSSRF